MSLDLSAAVEAAADDLFRVAVVSGEGIADRETYRRDALTVLSAAAPVIEASVRAQIAAEIEAYLASPDRPADYWITCAYQHAAHVARGESS